MSDLALKTDLRSPEQLDTIPAEALALALIAALEEAQP